jgi:DNA helicase-2/ATP-dependent DNA helicase PcrA
LYRANFQSRILEEKLLKAGIPYQVLGTKFFDRAEIKDLMAYVRLAVNPESQVDLKRVINVPKRGIGKASVVRIFSGDVENLPAKAKKSYQEFQEILAKAGDFASQNLPSELVKFVIDILGFQNMAEEVNSEDLLERLANMFELSEFAKKYDEFGAEKGLEMFLDEVALMSDQDTKKDDKKEPRVKLMTIHASKGLEFHSVFLTGAEEALFSPQMGEEKRKMEDIAEEERRLFYVAMTRAKKKLFLS